VRQAGCGRSSQPVAEEEDVVERLASGEVVAVGDGYALGDAA